LTVSVTTLATAGRKKFVERQKKSIRGNGKDLSLTLGQNKGHKEGKKRDPDGEIYSTDAHQIQTAEKGSGRGGLHNDEENAKGGGAAARIRQKQKGVGKEKEKGGGTGCLISMQLREEWRVFSSSGYEMPSRGRVGRQLESS